MSFPVEAGCDVDEEGGIPIVTAEPPMRMGLATVPPTPAMENPAGAGDGRMDGGGWELDEVTSDTAWEEGGGFVEGVVVPDEEEEEEEGAVGKGEEEVEVLVDVFFFSAIARWTISFIKTCWSCSLVFKWGTLFCTSITVSHMIVK